MPRNPAIRPGRPDDVEWVLAQLREFAELFGTNTSLFGDTDHARNFVLEIIDKHVFLVAERDGKLIGFIAGIVAPHVFNPSIRMLTELWWWVDKAARGSRAGLMLLNAFVEWGRKNADWINFTLERRSPVNERVLEERGFRMQERNFLMEVS